MKDLKKNLTDKLKVYGYYISNVVIPLNNKYTHKFIIEPIKPSELIPDPSNGKFYHVIYKDYLDNIQRIGLTPKDSRTIFTHPGNRIYMIQTKDLKLLNQLKYALSNSRQESLKGKKYPQHLIDEMTPENMVVLEINVDGLKLYNDPMFPSYMKTFFACFTTQNISPDRIKLTNY